MKSLMLIAFLCLFSMSAFATIDPITGTLTVCAGGTTTLADATPGGTWVSDDPTVAGVATSGIVTGVAGGTTNITYTVGSESAYVTVTVNASPAAYSVTGGGTYCAGGYTVNIVLSGSSSGISYQLYMGAAAVGSAIAGTGTAMSFGTFTATGTYSAVATNMATGCTSLMTGTASITPGASAPTITGMGTVCPGSSISLSASVVGGTWSSSNVAVAMVDMSGVLTGTSPGTATISYMASGYCPATAVVTVTPSPTITGSTGICNLTTTTLSASPAGGTWVSSAPSIGDFTSSTSGIFTGAGIGTTTITYTAPSGCVATRIETVAIAPPPVAGTFVICTGTATTLTCGYPGGTWTSAVSSVATIGLTSGVAVGLAAGTTTITYTMSTGCVSTRVITVNPGPAPITGTLTICSGSAGTLTGSGGGTWTSSNLAVAAINPTTGIFPSASLGTATITYTLSTGCFTTAVVTVNSLPAPITGTLTVCTGTTTTLTSATPGGLWLCSPSTVATISTAVGGVTGVAAGTATVSYRVIGCTTTAVITVNPLPTAILGILSVCSGSTTTLMDATTGGTWSSSNTAVATVGSSNGVVTGGAGGTAVITYTVPTGCYRMAVITVNPTPTLSGSTGICTGATTTLTSSTGGGTWSSGSTGVATVDAAGVVSGLTTGTAVISYASTACGTSATIVVTVSPSAAPITGTLSLCVGNSSTLADATGGGTWSIDAGGAATISGAGVLTGVTAGTTTITYTAGSCTAATAVATVYAMPSAISGTLAICNGFISTLTATPTGGTWSSSNVFYCTVGTSTGIVVGIDPGTSTINYVTPGGCYSTVVVTVNPLPALTGPSVVCAGATITVNTSIPGGAWAIAPSTTASVTGSGVVAGIAAGTATLSYTSLAGCPASRIVTVNSACSGTLSGGTADAGSGAICGGGYVTISLSGSTAGCGISLQWQSSPDGTTWTDIAGTTNNSVTQYPTSSTYYRCATICSGGSTVYSTSAFVSVMYTIAYHDIVVSPDSACTSAHFYMQSCGASAALTVITWFGDGTNGTNALSPIYSTYFANVNHAYAMPGTYTVKQVMYNAGVACDSVTFTYEKVSCQTMPIWYYKDNNTNCVFDAGDALTWSATATEVDSAGTAIDTIYATTGFYYTARGPVGTVYAFRGLIGSGGYSVMCPATSVLYDTVSSMGITAAKYFGLQCSSIAFDLSISDGTAAHSTVGNAYLTASNLYCASTPHTVTAHISPRYNFSYAVPAPTSVSGNTVIWDFASSSPAVTEGIYIAYTAVSFITPGDTVHMDYSITPTSGDVNTANNYVTRVCTVTGSYDPNIISVTPEGLVLPCTTLKYAVMFQNDGNDTAHNIHVLDTLSANLDESSLQVLSSSAVMSFSTLHSGGYTIVKFDFPNITLLDSSHHDKCTGTFSFSIKAKTGLADGIAIPNQVGIYFDDNPVVMTNNISNTIGISPITGVNEVCAGDTIILADATAGGVWAAAGSGITLGIVSTGVSVIGGTAGTHTISYTVTNSCASKTATKSVTVNATVSPSVSATASPSYNVCVGTDITLTPAPVYGGSAPTYEWIKDGVLAGTGATYTYAPVSAHTVVCRMTSNYTCRAYDTVSSPEMIQIGEPHYIPTITVTVAPAYYVAAGTPVTFTAGGMATGHQWYLNNVAVPGATGADWTTSSLNEGDSICCHAFYSAGCTDSFISCTIIHVVEGVTEGAAQAGFSLVPNPNNGSFALQGHIPSLAGETTVAIQDVLGQMVYVTTIGVHNGNVDAQLVLPTGIANGVYIANIGGGAERRSIHFVLRR
jgi:uncharacterized protein YjdB